MNDFSKLKTIAQEYSDLIDCEDQDSWAEARAEYEFSARVDVVLALISEVERMQREEKNDAIAYKAVIERQNEIRNDRDQIKLESECFREQHDRDSAELRIQCQARDDARKERDQLKIEIESLRKEIESLQSFKCAKI